MQPYVPGSIQRKFKNKKRSVYYQRIRLGKPKRMNNYFKVEYESEDITPLL